MVIFTPRAFGENRNQLEISEQHCSTDNRYLKGLEANLGSHSLMDKFGFDEEDLLLAFCFVDVPGGLYLHYGMFIPTITSQVSFFEAMLPLGGACAHAWFMLSSMYSAPELLAGQ